MQRGQVSRPDPSAGTTNYFLPPLACARSLPETDLTFGGVFGSLSSFPAIEASFLEVATESPPLCC